LLRARANFGALPWRVFAGWDDVSGAGRPQRLSSNAIATVRGGLRIVHQTGRLPEATPGIEPGSVRPIDRLFSPRSGKWGADCGVNSHGRVPSVQAGHEIPLPRIELHQFPNACQFAALYLLAAPACWLGLQPAPAAQPLTVEVQAAMALASWPVRLTEYGLLAASRRCGSKGGINIPAQRRK
jgi:hypothetical protein